jgi:hypothetical protein
VQFVVIASKLIDKGIRVVPLQVQHRASAREVDSALTGSHSVTGTAAAAANAEAAEAIITNKNTYHHIIHLYECNSGIAEDAEKN